MRTDYDPKTVAMVERFKVALGLSVLTRYQRSLSFLTSNKMSLRVGKLSRREVRMLGHAFGGRGLGFTAVHVLKGCPGRLNMWDPQG